MNESAVAKRMSLLLHHQLDCFAFARNDGDCIQINKKDKKEVFLQSAVEQSPERIEQPIKLERVKGIEPKSMTIGSGQSPTANRKKLRGFDTNTLQYVVTKNWSG